MAKREKEIEEAKALAGELVDQANTASLVADQASVALHSVLWRLPIYNDEANRHAAVALAIAGLPVTAQLRDIEFAKAKAESDYYHNTIEQLTALIPTGQKSLFDLLTTAAEARRDAKEAVSKAERAGMNPNYLKYLTYAAAGIAGSWMSFGLGRSAP